MLSGLRSTARSSKRDGSFRSAVDARNRCYPRNVVDIKLTAEEQVPDVQSVIRRIVTDELNSADGCVFFASNSITFQGVADDLGSPIGAVNSPSTAAKPGPCPPKAPRRQMGELAVRDFVRRSRQYQLTVRARTADGCSLPLGNEPFEVL
ncbi:MAG: hypothetical protein ACLTQI_01110 [Slackia sp.]